jgi:hypothetical protein
MAGVTRSLLETPTKTSAPSSASSSECRSVVEIVPSPFVQDALRVDHQDIGRIDAQRDVHVGARNACRAGAREHDTDLRDVALGQFERVQQCGTADDGRAVLIIVEHGYVHHLLKRFLDVETLWRLDVLEVDAAEGRLEQLDATDQLVGVLGAKLDIEDVDIREPLEQDGFALHDGLARERPDVAEAEDGRAIGHDSDQVAPGRVREDIRWIFVDQPARQRHARRVRHGQVALRKARLRGYNLDLARPEAIVVLQNIVVADHGMYPRPKSCGCLPRSDGSARKGSPTRPDQRDPGRGP